MGQCLLFIRYFRQIKKLFVYGLSFHVCFYYKLECFSDISKRIIYLGSCFSYKDVFWVSVLHTKSMFKKFNEQKVVIDVFDISR